MRNPEFKQCSAVVRVRVPSWPSPAGSLDRWRRCKREALRNGARCWQHRTHAGQVVRDA